MFKKAVYPVCLFLLTAAVCGFSALQKSLNSIQSLTCEIWPMWAGMVCYFLLGGIFVIAFVVENRSELNRPALVVSNLAFGILNVCLYFYFCMNPDVPPNRVFLIFGGFLIFSAPLKPRQKD